MYEATDKLLAAGVAFQKKPDEGRMKGLAFALDPDGPSFSVFTLTVPPALAC